MLWVEPRVDSLPVRSAARDDRVATTACLAAVAAIVAACVLVAARTDLWQPYEPDLVETAREMRERGDWLHPRLNGLPYLEKPPLYYWAVLCVWRLAGVVSEFGARVPSIAAAIVTLWAADGLSRDLFPSQRRWSAAAVLATMPVFFFCGFRGMTDGLFGAFVLVALWRFRRDAWPAASRPPRGESLVAWGALALAFLAKGPVSVVVVGLMLLPETIYTRRLASWAAEWRRHVPGVACFLVIVAPWYVAGCLEGGWRFLDEAVWRQNGGRFFGEGDDGPLFLPKMLPGQIGLWTLFLPGVAGLAWKSVRSRWEGEFDPARFLAVGALTVLAFLSVSSDKLPKYLLVVAPPLAILVAEVLGRVDGARPSGETFGSRVSVLAAGAVLVALGIVVPFAPLLAPRIEERVPGLSAAWLLPVGACLIAGGAATLVLARRRAWSACIPSIALGIAGAAVSVAATPTLARIDDSNTSRPFVERATSHFDPGTPLLGWGLSDCESLFLFYGRRSYECFGTGRACRFSERIRGAGRALVLTTTAELGRLAENKSIRFSELECQEAGKRDYVLLDVSAAR